MNFHPLQHHDIQRRDCQEVRTENDLKTLLSVDFLKGSKLDGIFIRIFMEWFKDQGALSRSATGLTARTFRARPGERAPAGE